MDPASIGTPQWTEISSLLIDLWVVVLFVILVAANMLLGHNFIPSLVASGHLPEKVQKTRAAFYGLALIFFGLAIFFLARVVDRASVLRDFWADYWI